MLAPPSRAADTGGRTVDVLLTPRRDRAAATAFVRKALPRRGVPETVTIAQAFRPPAARTCRPPPDRVATVGGYFSGRLPDSAFFTVFTAFAAPSFTFPAA